MNNQEQLLWTKLRTENIVTGDYVETDSEKSPWYLRILLGFSGWIAALFALGFLGTMFSFLFEEEGALLLFGLGIATSGIAFGFFKLMPKNEFSEQLGLVFNLTGQLMIAVGMYQFLESIEIIKWRKDAPFYLILGLFQIGLILAISDFNSRALSSLFALLSLGIFFDKVGLENLGVLLAAFSFALVWLRDSKWNTSAEFWSAIGYGIAAAFLILNIDVASGDGILGLFKSRPNGEFNQSIYWMSKIGLFLALFLTLIFIINQYRKEYSLNEFKIHFAVGGVLSVAALLIDGIAAPLILCLIGFYVQRSILLYSGILSLVGFFSWYYYNLELTLLIKSVMLIGLGLILLGSFLFFTKKRTNANAIKNKDKSSKLKWLGLIGVVLVLMIANWDIYRKEKLLSEGKIVYLELAPVDPRSIMQGDYMTLRFKIENEVEPEAEKYDSTNNEGFMLLELDNNHIGKFKALYRGGDVAKNQAVIKFRKRSYDIKLATSAFFFQEGKAKEYESAKYGEFRVDDNGEIILNALLDESLQVLGLNRPNQ